MSFFLPSAASGDEDDLVLDVEERRSVHGGHGCCLFVEEVMASRKKERERER